MQKLLKTYTYLVRWLDNFISANTPLCAGGASTTKTSYMQNLLRAAVWISSGVHFGNLNVPDTGKYADPGERKNLLSCLSLDMWASCLSVRILRVRLRTAGSGIEDFHDRALFGIALHRKGLIIEIMFTQICFA